MQTSLVVYVNNADALLVWTVDALDPACAGFAIQRRLARGNGWHDPTWLDNWAPPGTLGHPVGEHQPSSQWPFRCYSWTDHSLGAGGTVSYRVVPIDSAKQPDEASATDWSDEKTIGAPSATPYTPFFNRGFVMSQFMSRYLDDKYPGLTRPQALEAFKADVTDHDESAIRAFLSEHVRPALLKLLADAKAGGGHVYAALFELSDTELRDALADLGDHAHVVLSNGSIQAGANEPVGDVRKRDENDTARTCLLAHRVDVEQMNRFIAPTPLGHNKFMVVTDAASAPQMVWTGSTNWTPTGLCTQVNNALLCTDPDVAGAYLAQWHALRDAGSTHPSALTTSNSTPQAFGSDQPGQLRASVHFTRARNRVDLTALGDIVSGAAQGVLFLMFMPGSKGSLANVQALAAAQPDILVRGVVSTLPNGPASEQPGAPVAVRARLVGAPADVPDARTFDIVQPQGMQVAAGWAVETTRNQFFADIGFAIIHSKVLVVDPFSDDPTVVTGSHNFSISASENNDENFIVVRGDRALAEAYAVNIETVWRHYAARMGNPHKALFGTAYLQALLDSQQHERAFWGI